MRRSVGFVLAGWAALVATGQWMLLTHTTTAGDPGHPLVHLPPTLAARLDWPGTRPLLVVCAHPMCPCLPATLTELQRALRHGPAVDVRVLVHTPTAPPPAWHTRTLPGVRAQLPAGSERADVDGALARAIGVATSGHVLLYGTDGMLQFTGGVTAGRGHQGDSSAGRALVQALQTQGKSSVSTAVFGCPLVADSDPHEPECCQSVPEGGRATAR